MQFCGNFAPFFNYLRVLLRLKLRIFNKEC